MKTVWYQHLRSKEEQDRWKESVEGSKIVLDKALEICYNMLKSEETTTIVDYDSPSWAYRQADRNGAVRAIQKIIELLDIEGP